MNDCQTSCYLTVLRLPYSFVTRDCTPFWKMFLHLFRAGDFATQKVLHLFGSMNIFQLWLFINKACQTKRDCVNLYRNYCYWSDKQTWTNGIDPDQNIMFSSLNCDSISVPDQIKTLTTINNRINLLKWTKNASYYPISISFQK